MDSKTLGRFSLVLLFGFTAAAQPAPAAEESRLWTSHDGKHSTDAVFAGYAGGKVQLRKADDTTVDVPLVQLSEEDQAYVREVAEDHAESLAALEKLNVEMTRNKDGRVEEVHFRPASRITRRHVELLGGLPRLEKLTLAQVRVGDGALDTMESLPLLTHLDLTASGIGDAEVRKLTALKKLQSLNLADTQITNRALTYLKDLPSLTELVLANTRIADNGIANLEELKQLKKLNLANTRVSPQGVLRLRKALPNAAMEGSGVVRR